MFRNSYQRGFLSILFSCGSSPLEIWGTHVKNGYVRRVTDTDVKALVLELGGPNVATTYIHCPKDTKNTLGIRLPYLILDSTRMHRRFRMSNFQSKTRIKPFCTSMPIGLANGWNLIQFNLADFTRRAYQSSYVETTRIQIHANCRIRRIYFADRIYGEHEIPPQFRLLLPIQSKPSVREKPIERKSLLKTDKRESVVTIGDEQIKTEIKSEDYLAEDQERYSVGESKIRKESEGLLESEMDIFGEGRESKELIIREDESERSEEQFEESVFQEEPLPIDESRSELENEEESSDQEVIREITEQPQLEVEESENEKKIITEAEESIAQIKEELVDNSEESAEYAQPEINEDTLIGEEEQAAIERKELDKQSSENAEIENGNEELS